MDLKSKYTKETNRDPYCKESRLYVRNGSYTDNYVNWLEEQLALLRVVGQSEQLKAFREWTRENLNQEDVVTKDAIDMYLESL